MVSRDAQNTSQTRYDNILATIQNHAPHERTILMDQIQRDLR